MFILFGTKDRAVEIDSGQFHCPNCNLKKEYGKKYVQDWFTLFFIPIFPISGKKNNHIECKECQSIYHLDVIDYKPALNQNEMESEYQKALKNVLCLMIIADNEVKNEELNVVSDIYNKLTNNKKFSKNQIEKNIDLIKKSTKNVKEYLKKIKPYLNAGHRELIVKAMYYVASSDGHLDAKESKLLIKTATVLDMTPAHVKGVLTELDQKKIN